MTFDNHINSCNLCLHYRELTGRKLDERYVKICCLNQGGRAYEKGLELRDISEVIISGRWMGTSGGEGKEPKDVSQISYWSHWSHVSTICWDCEYLEGWKWLCVCVCVCACVVGRSRDWNADNFLHMDLFGVYRTFKWWCPQDTHLELKRENTWMKL